MLIMYYNYMFGVNYPILNLKEGMKVVHKTLGTATIIQAESCGTWFIIEFDDPKIHRQRINIEGSTFNGNPPVFEIIDLNN